MLRKRVNLFGVYIDDISLKRALFLARKSLCGGKKRCFYTPNLEMISRARREKQIKELLNSSSVALPDGFGLKILASIMQKKIENTVAGIDFGENLLALAENEGAKVFLLGAERGVAKKAAKNILLKHPHLKICGAFHGYFKQEQSGAVCRMIEKSGADILIVCMGFPRQESFARLMMKSEKSPKVIACLGGSLDVWSGKVNRSPKLMRDFHLEWLFRIANEPTRCGRFLKSLDAITGAMEKRIEKILFCGINKEETAYNQTDIL